MQMQQKAKAISEKNGRKKVERKLNFRYEISSHDYLNITVYF